MSTSNLGLNASTLRSSLPILTGALYTLGIYGGLHTLRDPTSGAKSFGIILPNSTPTNTETAYTRIHGIRNFANGAIGLSMLAFLEYSSYCTSFTTGPLVTTAVKKMLGYSMLIGAVVGVSDGWTLYQFSEAEGLDGEAKETAKRQRVGHVGMAVVPAVLGVGWLYA